MIKHNVFIQPQGDKVVLVTVLPANLFAKKFNQSYVVAKTSKTIYSNMNPSIVLDLSTHMDADEFCAMLDYPSMKGMGIAGVITEGPWFCQVTANPLAELMGEDS